MGREKTLRALDDLVYQLEENVLPMIVLSDDHDVVKRQIKKLRKVVNKERMALAGKQLVKQGLIEEVEPERPIDEMAPVRLKWKERHEQVRDRSAEIPVLQLIAWCKAKDIDWSEDFGADDLQLMLQECVQTSKGWRLGYGEWTDTGHEFVELHMAGRDD